MEVCYCSNGLKYVWDAQNVGLACCIGWPMSPRFIQIEFHKMAPVSYALLRRVATRGTIRRVPAISWELWMNISSTFTAKYTKGLQVPEVSEASYESSRAIKIKQMPSWLAAHSMKALHCKSNIYLFWDQSVILAAITYPTNATLTVHILWGVVIANRSWMSLYYFTAKLL